jgi:hypothetical protein
MEERAWEKKKSESKNTEKKRQKVGLREHLDGSKEKKKMSLDFRFLQRWFMNSYIFRDTTPFTESQTTFRRKMLKSTPSKKRT